MLSGAPYFHFLPDLLIFDSSSASELTIGKEIMFSSERDADAAT